MSPWYQYSDLLIDTTSSFLNQIFGCPKTAFWAAEESHSFGAAHYLARPEIHCETCQEFGCQNSAKCISGVRTKNFPILS